MTVATERFTIPSYTGDTMTRRDSPSGRRNYRLGPLSLVAETNVAFDLVDALVPETNPDAVDPPLATAWLSHAPIPPIPRAPAASVTDGISVWINHLTERAMLFGEMGHATVDLRDRWVRVDPGTKLRDAAALFDAAVAMVLGRAGVVLLNASAVIDIAGGGWLIVGEQPARTALVRAFVADGFAFVSDGTVLLRLSQHQPHVAIVESWHRPDGAWQQSGQRPSGDGAGDAAGVANGALTHDRWRPIAQARGVVIATDTYSHGASARWRSAARGDVATAITHAAAFAGLDDRMRELIHAICETGAGRVGVHATLNSAAPPASVSALRALANALEEMLR